jgi:UDP-N-acetylglucosamine--N-acetylmuramyl-(pentapeptide) pyrophosphoryl-undecaprenol N-acetylglucosamine transferase
MTNRHKTHDSFPRSGSNTLLVASSGGHLAQLHRLVNTFDLAEEARTWVTFDTPQSRSLLAGEQVIYVRDVAPRDWRSLAASFAPALRHLRIGAYDHVISTGAAVAINFLPLARALGARATYIESATRVEGFSLSGRVLARIPGLELYTQYGENASASRRWSYAGSIFDSFVGKDARNPAEVRRVLVTLGTVGFGFRRLVDHVHAILPSDAVVNWQIGPTDPSGLPAGRVHTALPYKRLRSLVQGADVVISHAGVGSALLALESGKMPILIPREAARGEHVDDHQQQIAQELAGRGIALARRPGELSADDLSRVARRVVSDGYRIRYDVTGSTRRAA